MRIPASRQPVVEKINDVLLFTRPWFLFFQSIAPTSSDPFVVTVSASPFSYTATDSGMVIVSGGTVSLIEYGRNGAFTDTGLTAGVIPIVEGDTVRVTYSVIPDVTFIRR